MKFELNKHHRNTPEQELLDDLKHVSAILQKGTVSKSEYGEAGKYSPGTLERRFGSWTDALAKAGLQVGVERNIEDEDLFRNIENVWISLGRQPSYEEIRRPLSKYSTNPYERRFGTWRKALEAFIVHVNREHPPIPVTTETTVVDAKQVIKHKTKRSISSLLKVQVLMKDGNKCKLCGVTVTGDNIHFDHIFPWSKGGETVLENLQVLCEEHNLAKGSWHESTL